MRWKKLINARATDAEYQDADNVIAQFGECGECGECSGYCPVQQRL